MTTESQTAFDIEEASWAVYQLCNFAFMQYLSEPLRHGGAECVGPKSVHIPPHIEAALDIAIKAFKPGEPTMRDGNQLFGPRVKLVFDAEHFKFVP